MNRLQYRSAFPIIALYIPIIICLMAAGPVFAVRSSDRVALGNPASTPTGYATTSQPGESLTTIDGSIGRRPVYTELVSIGVAPSDVLSVARSLKGIFDFRKAQPKDEFQVCLDPQNQLQKLTYKAGLTEKYVAHRTGNGKFNAYREEIEAEKEIIAKTFTLDNSLYQALTGQGEGYSLVTALTDIFSWDIDFYSLPRKGDTIRILFEQYAIDGRFVRYGNILAVQYISSRREFSAFYFDDGHQQGYFDESGIPLRKMFLRVPIKYDLCTSSYSLRRFNPVSKKYKRHNGIDYSAPHGTPIFATASGTVTFSGWRNGYGKMVIIRHPNGYQTCYGHCSRLLVKKGAHVKQGETIAKVGRTGRATGPHVHYETRINGKPVNPNSIKSTKGSPLPTDQRARFDNMVQTRLMMVEGSLAFKRRPDRR